MSEGQVNESLDEFADSIIPYGKFKGMTLRQISRSPQGLLFIDRVAQSETCQFHHATTLVAGQLADQIAGAIVEEADRRDRKKMVADFKANLNQGSDGQ